MHGGEASAETNSGTTRIGRSQKGGFQKGDPENRNEGTKAGRRVQQSERRYKKKEQGHGRAHSPKPPSCSSRKMPGLVDLSPLISEELRKDHARTPVLLLNWVREGEHLQDFVVVVLDARRMAFLVFLMLTHLGVLLR